MQEKIKIVTAHVNHFLKKSSRDNIPALAGQSAFFLILSAIPMLLFAFSIFSILTGKDIELSDFSEITDQDVFPFVKTLLEYVIDSVHRTTSGTAIISAVVMLWSAGKGMYCITDGILRVYHIPNNRFWIFKRIYAMGYTLVLLLMFLLGLIVMMINSIFAGAIDMLAGDVTHIYLLVRILMIVAFGLFQSVIMTVALMLFLRSRTKKPAYHSFRALYPGMLLAVIAWNGLTIGVVFYIRHFAVSSIYGSLASVFVAMIWVYFMMYILLYGIQLNYIYRRQFSRFRLFKRHQKQDNQTKNESEMTEEGEST